MASRTRIGTLNWQPSVRFVSVAYPPVQAIEMATTAEELRVALTMLASTGELSHEARRAFEALPFEDRLAGPGTSDALTPFLYRSASHFATESEGAWYAGIDVDTAFDEVWFHRVRELERSAPERATIELRELHSDLDLPVADTRGRRRTRPALYDDAAGGSIETRTFATMLRAAGIRGVAYDSVRRPGGACVALFRPRDVGVSVVQASTLRVDWTLDRGIVGRWRQTPWDIR